MRLKSDITRPKEFARGTEPEKWKDTVNIGAVPSTYVATLNGGKLGKAEEDRSNNGVIH